MKTIIDNDIIQAASFLAADELVGIPTETVYGLATNACSETAVAKIFTVKQRPFSSPLIVHVDNYEKIKPFVRYIPETAKPLFNAFSPGPLTVLLEGNGVLPTVVNDGRKLIAFRIPAHELTRTLLQAIPFPLVAPSANKFTTISPTTPQHVLKNFDGEIPYILDGGHCTVGIESTVVGFEENESPVIYRQGAITAEKIKSVVGRIASHKANDDTPSPGLLKHHYSPKTPLILVDDLKQLPLEVALGRTGILAFNHYHSAIPRKQQFILSIQSNLNEAAQNLYKGLHYLDELSLDTIIAEKLPNIGIGIAINDRLQRAVHPSLYESTKQIASPQL
ncbi:MAG: threonylcarbamoyl-AMP synthase [Chitinophagaceae bacterium]